MVRAILRGTNSYATLSRTPSSLLPPVGYSRRGRVGLCIVEAHLVDDIQMHEVVGCFIIAPVLRRPIWTPRQSRSTPSRASMPGRTTPSGSPFTQATARTQVFLLPRFRLLIGGTSACGSKPV